MKFRKLKSGELVSILIKLILFPEYTLMQLWWEFLDNSLHNSKHNLSYQWKLATMTEKTENDYDTSLNSVSDQKILRNQKNIIFGFKYKICENSWWNCCKNYHSPWGI